ncbi:TIR domain-containing protein [Escherichia coli]|uniref:TIR domain-containing protein n=1 Tax=Escherichia coli TaxID=562 RepID=UPI000B5028DD|nr:TIR domain-containing protein [Escherichia coli]
MKIFLAHAKEDETITEEIYERLKSGGYSPWMDVKDIPAGVNWDYEIQKNFANSNLIILILSKVSTQKNGYIRREINDAIDKLKYYKPDDVFVIPLLIDDCEVPAYISSKLQFIDFKRNDGWDILSRSLRLAASQQKLEISQGITYGPFNFSSEVFKEEYNKIPGHEIEIAYPRIESHTLPKSAKLISDYFSGKAALHIFSERTSLWPGTPYWDEEYKHTYTSSYNESYNISYCNENVMSILHSVHWYGAGAAHPNSHFETSNFVITKDDYAYKFSLWNVFTEGKEQEAINKIKQKIISESAREFWEKTGEKPSEDDISTFATGIMDSNLDSFTINSDGFRFHFAPYEIHAYAFGSWEFFISFFEVIDFLKEDGIYSLIRS